MTAPLAAGRNNPVSSAATDEAIHVSFWDQLDEIGIDAYPPLTTSLSPTVDQMINAWNSMSADNYWAGVMNHMSPVDFFHSLATQYGKQVLFTEVGYRSVDGTNISPGGWSGNRGRRAGRPSRR